MLVIKKGVKGNKKSNKKKGKKKFYGFSIQPHQCLVRLVALARCTPH